MIYVTRKKTGKLVGRNVPEELLDSFLSALPAGVYGVEDGDGKEINVTIVRNGRVQYAPNTPCNTPCAILEGAVA